MNCKIKHLLLLTVMAFMAVMVSCAKDDEISLGSVKVDVKVTNITPNDVLMEFSLNNEHPFSIYSVRIFKKGTPAYVTNHGYNSDNEVTMYDYNSNSYNSCVINGLEANATYTYEIVIIQEGDRPINSGSNTDDGWGRLVLSDSSYTFTTASDYGDLFDATMTVSYDISGTNNRYNKASIRFDFDRRLIIEDIYGSVDLTLNNIQYSARDYVTQMGNGYLNVMLRNKEYDINSGIAPSTTYAVKLNAIFAYQLDNGSTILINNGKSVTMNITPDSFTTPADF